MEFLKGKKICILESEDEFVSLTRKDWSKINSRIGKHSFGIYYRDSSCSLVVPMYNGLPKMVKGNSQIPDNMIIAYDWEEPDSILELQRSIRDIKIPELELLFVHVPVAYKSIYSNVLNYYVFDPRTIETSKATIIPYSRELLLRRYHQIGGRECVDKYIFLLLDFEDNIILTKED